MNLSTPLMSVTFINTVLYAVSVAGLLFYWRERRIASVMPMLSYFLLSLAVWGGVLIAKMFFGYTGPSRFVSNLMGTKEMMAPITMIAVILVDCILTRKMRKGQADG